MNEKQILIVTASTDTHAYGPVSSQLQSKGYNTVVYKSDKVMKGEESFDLLVSSDGELSMTYEGIQIEPRSISAAWYRKPGDFALADADKDLAKQQYMSNEVRSLHGTIWPLYDEDTWLNAPSKIVEAEQKLRQQLVARELGFTIVDTLVTNDWQAVTQLQNRHDHLAIKMMRGILAEGNQLKGMHTTPLTDAMIDKLRSYAVPFPGLIQPFLNKYKEWRVTVVGQDVFPAAIYTDDSAKDDWRKHQNTPAVEFKSEEFDDQISDQCVRYLSRMGLGYGAFDFIETEQGETVFLECNPNGQFGWLEERLGHPITNSIANHLLTIAKQRSE
jgi:hypothetical protein